MQYLLLFLSMGLHVTFKCTLPLFLTYTFINNTDLLPSGSAQWDSHSLHNKIRSPRDFSIGNWSGLSSPFHYSTYSDENSNCEDSLASASSLTGVVSPLQTDWGSKSPTHILSHPTPDYKLCLCYVIRTYPTLLIDRCNMSAQHRLWRFIHSLYIFLHLQFCFCFCHTMSLCCI